MSFQCPHCGRPGISLADKFFTSASLWTSRPSTCRLCRKTARLPGHAVKLQFTLFVIALAVIPWVVPAAYRVTVALAVAAVMIAIGILAPLKRQLL